MKKHIVIDARESGTTTGRYIDKLIENLHNLKPAYKITVLTKPHRVDFIKKIAPDFSAQTADIKEFTMSEQIKLLKQINNNEPDLVHFSMVQQPILYHGKIVTTMHDLTTLRFSNPLKNPLIFKSKQYIYGWVNKVAVKKSLKIITPSQFVKDDIINYSGVTPDKINVIYESADAIKEAPQAYKQLVGTKFMMYVGRPQPHKNLPALIDAFVKIQLKHPDIRLVLAGKKDSLYSQIEEGVKNQAIKNVIFTDFVSEGQLRWLYENAICYIFPSLSEGFGLPGLEAMAHDCPVVSSNATCLPEVYGDGAYYFNPRDVDDIAIKINDVLTSKKLRDQLIKKGRLQLQKYSWQKMAKETLEIYKQILKD